MAGTRKGATHPYYGFVLPKSIAALAKLARDGKAIDVFEYGLGCGPDGWLAEVGNASPPARPDAGELGYVRWPFEVVPFAWQGGDGLVYAMLVHAPETSETCPLVAHAPGDDPGCTWLGDDAAQGLANLAAVALRKPDEYDADPADVLRYRRRVDAAVAKVRAKLGLARIRDPKELTRGARSKRAAVPRLPKGWRHVPTVDRVGVIGPASAFAPGKPPSEKRPTDTDLALAHARETLARGFPATALLEARVVYKTASDVPAALVMRECYAALGRPHLVQRVDEYVAFFTQPKKKRRR